MRVLTRLAPFCLIGLLLLPIFAGLAGTFAPAFGLLDLGLETHASAFTTLLALPGLGTSAWLALSTGLCAAALALGLAFLTLAVFLDHPAFRVARRLLSPLMAVPHAAAAFGLVALIAPSGLVWRWLSPWATGWHRPPDLLIINDPHGLALLAGLAAKEAPFLLLMLIAALPQADATRSVLVARSLGYGRIAAFTLAVWPSLYRQIRLPVFAVLVYGASNVDMALILGPTSPPTLAVTAMRLATDADLSLRGTAAATAVLQTAIVVIAALLWAFGERLFGLGLGHVATSGRRWHASPAGRACGLAFGAFAAALPIIVVGGGLAALALWSLAGPWQFSQAFPDALTLHTWRIALEGFAMPCANAASLAFAASLLATLLVLFCLEHEDEVGRRPGPLARLVLYAPLLVPQIAFLFGLSVLFIGVRLDGTFAGLLVAHLVFVCPYVYLSLAGPWRAFDGRYALIARALGRTPWQVLWRVRLPILLRPVLTTVALGFAVSVALYLPTRIIAAGQFETVTTQAVALAAGLDRRMIGAAALIQSLLPGLAFALALLVPAYLHRHRIGLAAGGMS
jgi:putative thiamine transport system permease protein